MFVLSTDNLQLVKFMFFFKQELYNCFVLLKWAKSENSTFQKLFLLI